MWYFILMFILGCLLIKNRELAIKNKINYSNYKNALLALAEYDPKLAQYLETNNFR